MREKLEYQTYLTSAVFKRIDSQKHFSTTVTLVVDDLRREYPRVTGLKGRIYTSTAHGGGVYIWRAKLGAQPRKCIANLHPRDGLMFI